MTKCLIFGLFIVLSAFIGYGWGLELYLEFHQTRWYVSTKGGPRCVLCACFRTEGYYLQDWVDYHLDLGFDQILLFDNNQGQDDLEYLSNISRNKRVRIINKRDVPYEQQNWFSQAYNSLTSDDFGLFIDIDEYLTFAPGITLKHYAARAITSACQQVKINWLAYGNNGQILRTPGSVRERFPKPVADRMFKKKDHIENSHTKAFIRGGLNVTWPSMHWARGDIVGCGGSLRRARNNTPFVAKPEWKVAWIRHYQSRSEQEWCWKMRRWNISAYNWENYDASNRLPPNKPRTGLVGDDCRPI